MVVLFGIIVQGTYRGISQVSAKNDCDKLPCNVGNVYFVLLENHRADFSKEGFY